MKHLTRTGLAALSLLALPAIAHAGSASVTQSGAFIAIQGGKSHFDIDRDESGGSHSAQEDDTGTSFGVLGGYRWVVARPFSFGVELGYVNLGKTDWRQVSGGLSTRFLTREKSKSDAVLLGVNGKWDLPYSLTVTARAGVAHVRTRYDAGSTSYYVFQPEPTIALSRSSSSDNTIYAGVGFGYDFNENIGVTLTYDRYSFKADGLADLGHTAHTGIAGVNLEYRFW